MVDKKKIADKILKSINSQYATVASAGIDAGDVTGYVNTGSMSLNALLSGSIHNGLPIPKVVALAGEKAVGKTYYAINICRQFQQDNPDGYVVYFETESAVSKKMLIERGIDGDRLIHSSVHTVEEFRTQAMNVLEDSLQEKPDDRVPMLFVLDSLGNLSTNKELADMKEGKDTRDMTRAALVKGAFRGLTLLLGRAHVPMIITNHVYDVIGSYIPTKKQSGGSGLEYAASTIVFLSKKKDKTGEGAIITANLVKGRETIENKRVETLLRYSTGLDPYYGLLDLAEKFGIFVKNAKEKKYELPDGTKVFEFVIEKNPEKYFTKDILDKIDDACKNEFLYGNTNVLDIDEIRKTEESDGTEELIEKVKEKKGKANG